MASLGSLPSGIERKRNQQGAVIVFVAAMAKSLTDLITSFWSTLLVHPRRLRSALTSSTPVQNRALMQLLLSLSPGGTERLVIELCRRLAADVDSVVGCLDGTGDWAAEVEKLNIPVHLTLAQAWISSVALGPPRRGPQEPQRINVIHCHHYSPFV
jgi:hypothetical protein